MVTPINYHTKYPSEFIITNDSTDITTLKNDYPNCVIGSHAINDVTKSLWIVQKCTSDATKLAWHKVGTSTEVACS